MHKLVVFLLLIFSSLSFAQIHEVGLYFGGTNTIADVGSTSYIRPNDVAFGGIYKWNRSPRHSYRFTAIYAKVKDADKNSTDERRKIRNLSFENNIMELSAGLEFTFFDFDLHDKYHSFVKTTPYLYTGLSFFHYDALVLENGSINKHNTHSSFAIPMSLGIKTAISRRFILSFEVSARYTFTDALDGSNPVRDKAPYEELKFGNTNSNDWYVFTGFTLTYTFGQNPCFCNY